MDGSFAAFLGIAALVIMTPGQDTALTIRNTLLGGRRGGVATALGIVSGIACWTVAASAGLAALLVASEPVFVGLKLAGAAYLVFLGLQALRRAVRPIAHDVDSLGSSPLAPQRAYQQGLLSNLGNPKIAVFFTSLLPQFVPGGGASFVTLILLGLIFATMTLAWLSCYAVVVEKAGNVLRRPRARRAIEAVTGTVLVGLGLRLALTER
jgi:threonine/homoserine/homoserine lactone efflux protein